MEIHVAGQEVVTWVSDHVEAVVEIEVARSGAARA